jgi:hypothetical protein
MSGHTRDEALGESERVRGMFVTSFIVAHRVQRDRGGLFFCARPRSEYLVGARAGDHDGGQPLATPIFRNAQGISSLCQPGCIVLGQRATKPHGLCPPCFFICGRAVPFSVLSRRGLCGRVIRRILHRYSVVFSSLFCFFFFYRGRMD